MSFQPSGSGRHCGDDDAAMLVDHNPVLVPIVTGADTSSTVPFSDPRSTTVTQTLESSTQTRKRPHRQRRLPARYRDVLPEPAPVVLANETDTSDPTLTRPLPRIRLIVRDTIQTVANLFGLWRQYPHRPSYDPDHSIPFDSLASSDLSDTHLGGDPKETDSSHTHKSPPKSNFSVDILLDWQNSGSSTKSHAEVDRLVEVLRHPGFSVNKLPKNFNSARENRKRDQQEEVSTHLKGFQETSVKIEVPSGDQNISSHFVDIPGLYFRRLTTIIQEAFASPLASRFHYSPFKLFHTSPDSGEQQRVYSELYNSDAFLTEHDSIQRTPLPPDDPNCKREKVIAALMFWSDSTLLANFGTAKLWPIYLFFGNLSKYIRAEPSSQACYHVAYIPSLPDSLQDLLGSIHAHWNTQKKAILTHCRRELIHGVWRLLLDDDFVHAYKYGIVIKCHDGIERRVYPRIFTYSADYPEKWVNSLGLYLFVLLTLSFNRVLLATIRDNGNCPCPRCLIPKKQLNRMGLKHDIQFRLKNPRKFLFRQVQAARKWIYQKGRSITSRAVELVLKPSSSVPTMVGYKFWFDLGGSRP